MLNTLEAITHLLQGTILDGRAIRQLAIDESDEWAFEITVPQAEALAAWQVMRSRLTETQRYPVLTEGWGTDDYFSRFYYREEVSAGKLRSTSPRAILMDAAAADMDTFLNAKRMLRRNDLDNRIKQALAETRERLGHCPDPAQIRELVGSAGVDQQVIQSTVDLEKWLFDWELQQVDAAGIEPDTSYLDWFEPNSQTAVLLLLPVEQGWETLAYLHWFAACAAGTPVAIGFLQQWFQQYNAELVCHYGTMLQLTVGRPPETAAAAFELAWQQEALAECTTILPGVSLREHARSLLTVDRWFLHERP